MKRSCVALLSVCLFSIPLAHADTQPTKEGAHAFLNEMVSSHKLQEFILDIVDYEGVQSYSGVRVNNFNSSKCETSYSINNLLIAIAKSGHTSSARQHFDRTIDWSKVSEIHNRKLDNRYSTPTPGVTGRLL